MILGFREKLKMPLVRSLVGGTAGLVFMGAVFGLSQAAHVYWSLTLGWGIGSCFIVHILHFLKCPINRV